MSQRLITLSSNSTTPFVTKAGYLVDFEISVLNPNANLTVQFYNWELADLGTITLGNKSHIKGVNVQLGKLVLSDTTNYDVIVYYAIKMNRQGCAPSSISVVDDTSEMSYGGVSIDPRQIRSLDSSDKPDRNWALTSSDQVSEQNILNRIPKPLTYDSSNNLIQTFAGSQTPVLVNQYLSTGMVGFSNSTALDWGADAENQNFFFKTSIPSGGFLHIKKAYFQGTVFEDFGDHYIINGSNMASFPNEIFGMKNGTDIGAKFSREFTLETAASSASIFSSINQGIMIVDIDAKTFNNTTSALNFEIGLTSLNSYQTTGTTLIFEIKYEANCPLSWSLDSTFSANGYDAIYQNGGMQSSGSTGTLKPLVD